MREDWSSHCLSQPSGNTIQWNAIVKLSFEVSIGHIAASTCTVLWFRVLAASSQYLSMHQPEALFEADICWFSAISNNEDGVRLSMSLSFAFQVLKGISLTILLCHQILLCQLLGIVHQISLQYRTLHSVAGVHAHRSEGQTGVWIDEQKIAAIGIRARRWITYHGLAMNITVDLSPYTYIVPCGIADKTVTRVLDLHEYKSQQSRANHGKLLQVYSDALLSHFQQVFDISFQIQSWTLLWCKLRQRRCNDQES